MTDNNNMETEYTYEDYEAMAEYLLSRQPHRPKIGIICGSGLAEMANKLEERYNIPYEKIQNFPVSTVEGHIGQFAFGTLMGKQVVMMQGRFHLYEGYPAWKVIAPIRVMKILGVETLIVTTACGGLNPAYKVGDIMLLIDHIGIPTLSGINPLTGKNHDRFGGRFPDMNGAYDAELMKSTLKVAENLHMASIVKQGVYVMVSGPSFETPAECRYLRALGGDVVGMSTVPEVLAARHCGMRALGMALVTDMVVSDYHSGMTVSHEDVLEISKWRAGVLQDIIMGVVERMDQD
ncbi:purine nucleoside phosphorylase-like [Diadema antillarum]|uniref:purine nucleoside phosphorylase-like n=1 Tax=Diadema antillarum TaxID=105358 RepID=UPI003A88DDCD